MNNVSFRVRLLSGKLQHFAVDANTPISDSKAKFDENLPPFHETRLCLGDVELCNGSVLEVSIQEGAQVQAVTIPLIEAAVEVFRQTCMQVITSLDPWRCSSYEEHVASIDTSVLEFLEQHQAYLNEQNCKAIQKPIVLILCCCEDMVDCRPSPEYLDSLLSKRFLRIIDFCSHVLGKFGDVADLNEDERTMFNIIKRRVEEESGDMNDHEKTTLKRIYDAVSLMEKRARNSKEKQQE